MNSTKYTSLVFELTKLSIEDTWTTTDDETGLEKSEVVFYLFLYSFKNAENIFI